MGTWNAANLEPPYDTLPLREWLLRGESEPSADLYVVGFQELGGGLGGGGSGKGGDAANKGEPSMSPTHAAGGGGGAGDAREPARDDAPRRALRPPPPACRRRAPRPAGLPRVRAERDAARDGVGAAEGARRRVLARRGSADVPDPPLRAARSSHAHHASRVAVAHVPTFRAAYNKVGTQATPKVLARRKGGVAVSLSLGRTSFCFVTAHLAAHQGERGQLLERNLDSVRVLHSLLGDGRDACTAFDHLFVCGDLNYRLGSADLPGQGVGRATRGPRLLA